MSVNNTDFGTGAAVTRWRKRFAIEATAARFFEIVVGPGKDSIIQRLTNLEGQRGDTIKIDLKYLLKSAGVSGDGTRAGNEEQIQYARQDVVLDSLWNGTIDEGKLRNQAVLYNFREESMESLADWHADKKDEEIVETLSASPTRALGADDGGTPAYDATAKSNLVAADVITVGDIRRLKALATKPRVATDVRIRPFIRNGKKYFMLVLGTESMLELKKDSTYESYLENAWWRGDKNPLFSDAEVIIDRVIIHEFEGILDFDDGGSGAVHGEQNLFLGAQAAVISMTKDGTDWNEEEVDRGNKQAIGGTIIRTIDKTVFDSRDMAVISYYCATSALQA